MIIKFKEITLTWDEYQELITKTESNIEDREYEVHRERLNEIAQALLDRGIISTVNTLVPYSSIMEGLKSDYDCSKK